MPQGATGRENMSLPKDGNDAIEGGGQIREVEAAELAGGIGHGKYH